MESNTLIVGDCIEVLSSFEDQSIDFILTSPPYDNLRDYRGYDFDFEQIAQQLIRVLKNGRCLVWVSADQTIDGGESGNSFRQALYFIENGLILHDTMIYQKNGPPYPDQVRYYQVFEYMFVFAKGKPTIFNPISDRKNEWFGTKWGMSRTKRQTDGSLKKQAYKDVEKYGVRFNIWKYKTGHGYHATDEYYKQHPATFPEKLAEDHIRSWSNPGDLVLDPMCGAGTTCKMAKRLDRRYIGIDISKEYIEIARKRINSQSPPLFLVD